MQDVQKWYQSKIVAIAGTALLVFGSNLLLGWLTGPVGVSIEQVQGVEQTVPQVNDIVSRLKSGEGILSVAGSIFSLAVLYFRIWGTTKLIPQSLKK